MLNRVEALTDRSRLVLLLVPGERGSLSSLTAPLEREKSKQNGEKNKK